MGISITNITRPGANLQVGNNPQIGVLPAATNPSALHVEEFTGVVEGTIARHAIMRDYIAVRPVRGPSPRRTLPAFLTFCPSPASVILMTHARFSAPVSSRYTSSYTSSGASWHNSSRRAP